MNIDLLLIGFGIGFLSVLPVGPVNVMCISRSLHLGLVAGLATGFGGLIADVFFAAAALFGIKAIMAFISTYKMTLQIIGGGILIAIGTHIITTKAEFKNDFSGKSYSITKLIIGTFIVTIANPAPLFYFASAFSPLGTALNSEKSFINAMTVLAGVTAGAGIWWCTLATAVSSLRTKFTLKWLTTINLISGAILIIFGVVIMIDYIFNLNLIDKLNT